MALLSRKRLILVKTEATYGTDSSPAGTDALLVRNLDITPLSGEIVSRDLIRPYLGNFDQLIAQTSVAINFEVELAGSGTAGTAPKYDAILKACGLAATIVSSTSVTYAPVSASFSSATIYFNLDGVLHKLTGCRGSMTMSCAVGAIPTLAFNLTGTYNAPTDTAAPAVTYSAQAVPLIFREGNTSAFSFFSYSGQLQSVDFNLANDLVYRELVGGVQETLITDRKPAGTVMIEALASSTGNLTFLHGTTAGNRVTFTASQVDVLNPTYQDQDSIMMLSVPYVALPTTAGNNEFSLAFT